MNGCNCSGNSNQKRARERERIKNADGKCFEIILAYINRHFIRHMAVERTTNWNITVEIFRNKSGIKKIGRWKGTERRNNFNLLMRCVCFLQPFFPSGEWQMAFGAG